MSNTKKKNKKTPSAPRGIEALTSILHCKGGPMRDRRDRRPKDARRMREWME